MRWRYAELSVNQRLALAAASLGLVGLFAHPYRGHAVTLDVEELAALVDREADHVTAGELAGWIVEGRADFRLIDLRSEKQYREYHIPTAENVTLAQLPEAALEPTEKAVLYSEGGIHASQAWLLMRARGMKRVYALKGGLDQWKDEVLFPSLAPNATPEERARFERAAAVARFFGGSPRTGQAGDAAAAKLPELPKLEAPAAPAGTGPMTPRKKKEGC